MSSWVLCPPKDDTGGVKEVPLKLHEPIVLGRNVSTGIKKEVMNLSRNQVQVQLDEIHTGKCTVRQLSKNETSAIDMVELGESGNCAVLRPGSTLQLLLPSTQHGYNMEFTLKKKYDGTISSVVEHDVHASSPLTSNAEPEVSVETTTKRRRIQDSQTNNDIESKSEKTVEAKSDRMLGALIGIGTMALGVSYPDPGLVPSAAESIRMLHRAMDLGVNLIDTADCYSFNCKDTHQVEKLIARALTTYRGDRDISDVIVATKGGMWRMRDDSNGWRFKNMARNTTITTIEASHKALGGDKPIPLWQFHHPQCTGEKWQSAFIITMKAVKECVDSGLIERVGLCNVSIQHIEIASNILPIFSVQNRFSIWDKRATKPCPPHSPPSCQKGLLEYCTKKKIHFFPHGALGGLNARRGAIKFNNTIQGMADRKGVSVHHLLLSFYKLQYSCISHICGFRTMQHMEDAIAASIQPVPLSSGEMNSIKQACKL